MLDQALPGGFRRGAKDQQGTAEQFVQARARDLRSEKVGDEPGLDALEFADFDDAFDPLEIRLFGADDDAAGGMLVEQFNESLQRRFDKVKLAHDFDAFVGLLFQFMAQPGNFVAGADQDETAFVLRLGEFAFVNGTQNFFLEIHQGETKATEPHDHPARHVQVQGIHGEHQADGNEHAAFEERPQNCAARTQNGAVVKALQFQNERRARDEHEVKPSDIFKRIRRHRV